MALTKPPPPPPIASRDPTLNRWFLAVTAFLKNNGTIDGGSVDGFTALQADVLALNAGVTTLQGQVGILQGQVGALQGQVTALQASVATLNGQVATLQARAQVFNGTGAPGAGLGSNGDWYANTTGAAGSRIYIKVAGAWAAFPF